MNWKEAIDKIRNWKCFIDFELDTNGEKEFGNELSIIEKELDTIETLKKHIKVVNGQLIFKGISPKKNKKDYQKILEVLGL